MGRIVYAEECLLNYLATLKNPDDYTIGLILGQVGYYISNDNCYHYVIQMF